MKKVVTWAVLILLTLVSYWALASAAPETTAAKKGRAVAPQSIVLSFKLEGCTFKWTSTELSVTQTFPVTVEKAKFADLLFNIDEVELGFYFKVTEEDLFIMKGEFTTPPNKKVVKKTIAGKTVYVLKYKRDNVLPYSVYTHIGNGFRVQQEGPANKAVPKEFLSVLKSIKAVKA